LREGSDAGFSLENLKRPAPGANEMSKALILVTTYYLAGSADSFVKFFDDELTPKVTNAGCSILATFVTENHPNTFPALPVREGENVFVSFSRFADRGSYEQNAAALTNSILGKGVAEKLSTLTKGPAEILLLAPTSRSLVR
jgi:hypothetical protein